MQRKWMTRVTRYFDLWGHCTQFEATKRCEIVYVIILLVHILLTLINWWSIIVFLNKPTNDTLGHWNDEFKLKSFLLVCCVSVIESYVKRRRRKKFWMIFDQIERQFRSNQSLQLNNYLFIFRFSVIYSISANVYYTIQHIGTGLILDTESMVFWYGYVAMINIYQTGIWCYGFHLELVRHELKVIERLVRNAVKFNRSDYRRIIRKRNRRIMNHDDTLNRISQYYQMARELSDNINLILGWSNPLNILFSFGLILAEINWIYWKLYNQIEIIELIGQLWCFLNHFELHIEFVLEYTF